MSIVTVLVGILGLILVGLGIFGSGVAFVVGLALAISATVLGAVYRTTRSGKASLGLGLVAILLGARGGFVMLPRHGPPTVTVSAPSVAPAPTEH
jgi:hypothetical protein